jgi:hypothetical protein
MRLLKNRFFQVASVTGVVAVAGCLYFNWDRVHRAPDKTATAIVPEGRSSLVVLPIVASIPELQAKLEAEVPAQLFAIDEDRDACIPAQWIDECLIPNPFGGCIQRIKTKITPEVDCHLKGWVNRGSIQLGGSGNTLALSMPVSLSVTAKGLGIQETADGSATVAASASFDLSAAWEPTANVTADYKWNDKIGVDILGIRITFAGEVDPEIRKAIARFQETLPAELAKLKIKDRAAEAWPKGFVSIKAADDPPVWMRFSPTAIGYGGYRVADGQIRVNLMAAGLAETFLGGEPPKPPPTPLPALIRDLPNPGFQFYLPIFADYEALASAARKALKAGTIQSVDVPTVGQVQVTIEDIAFHQTTGEELAIGISLRADPEGQFLDTRGTVWLTSKLSVDNEKRLVTAEGLKIFGRTDNDAFDLLVSIIQLDPIMDAIRSSARYDFSEQHEQSMAKVNTQLRRQLSDEFYFDGHVDSIAADTVSAGPTAIQIGLSASGSGELHFGTLP